jgi:hypothetical protein
MMTELQIAIVVFGFNRSEHLKNLFESLLKNPSIGNYPLLIFIDGPRKNEEIRDVLATQDVVKSYSTKFNFVHQDFKLQNSGLANSIIQGLNTTFHDFDAAIILEDDIEVSPYFIDFMVSNLKKYRNVENIGSVTGYRFIKNPLLRSRQGYVAKRQSSWAWGTWKNRWTKVDWDILDTDKQNINHTFKALNKIGQDLPRFAMLQREKRIDSWAISFNADSATKGHKCVHPTVSLAINTGMDGSGTHYRNKKIQLKRLNRDWRSPDFSPDSLARRSRVYDFLIWWRYSNYFRFYINFPIAIYLQLRDVYRGFRKWLHTEAP